MQIEYKKKAIRSYVIRGGRMTAGQKNAFDQWWPDYGLSLRHGLIEPDALFSGGSHLDSRPLDKKPLVLEIGFGMGDSLFAMAQNRAENYIGIEVHPPGVGRLINNAGKAGLNNLKVYMADALDVLEECIPDNSLARLQLYFPDPWHKKKHNKRRIVQAAFVQLVRRKLKAGGCLHVATDWENYADHIMEVLSLAEGMENTAGDYLFSEKPDYRPLTKFERRGENLGHGVWDLLFRKTVS